MKDFPEFMKRPEDIVGRGSQFTDDIEGYVYDGRGGGQMIFWTCRADRETASHAHAFDEYMVVVAGRYVLRLDGVEHDLGPGDEIYIPRGSEISGLCLAGTRTIHAFGGQRARREKEGG